MPLQRACVAESQVRNKLSNGPLRVQSNVAITLQSILQRVGIRQLSEICWYLAKCTAIGRKFKVAPRIMCNYSSLTEFTFCQGLFHLFGFALSSAFNSIGGLY